MNTIIVIVLIILILCWIIKKVNENSLSENDDMTKILNEVSELFDELNTFTNRWKDFCGPIMLVPTNSNQEANAENSDRIKIVSFWEEKHNELLKTIFEQKDALLNFNLVQNSEGRFYFVTITKNNFDFKHKNKIIRNLNDVLKNKYPDINFEFDGKSIIKPRER